MNILILEDHKGAQQWLSDAAKQAFGDSVTIHIAETVKKSISLLDKRDFDLFIVDLHLPDGSGNKALIYAANKSPATTCVVATIYADESHLFPALQAGAKGYLLKDDSQETIAEMLAGVLSNRPPLSSEVASQLIGYFQQQRGGEGTDVRPHLTQREQETLQYLVKGFSIRECADYMGISPHTVSGYVKDVYKKLHVSSRAEVTAEAVRLGLV